VHLRGGQFVAPSEVEEKFLEDRGGGLLQVPLEERRREIEQIAWVRSATLTRVLPNHLWVTVEERVPVAFVWTSGGIALVDEEGVLLDRPPESSFTFPVARGISGRDSAAERRLRMQLFNGLIKELDAAALLPGEEISEVDLTDPQDVRVVVADASGAVQLHLGADQFRERYWVYAQNIRQWQRKFPSIESIDLRYEGQAVLNAGQRQSATVPNKTSGAPPASRPISQPRPETADGSGLAQPSR
jgi:cell division protein FtsQ